MNVEALAADLAKAAADAAAEELPTWASVLWTAMLRPKVHAAIARLLRERITGIDGLDARAVE